MSQKNQRRLNEHHFFLTRYQILSDINEMENDTDVAK